MRYIKTTGRLLCGFILIYGASFTAQASLVENGDFETGDLTGWVAPSTGSAGIELITWSGGNNLVRFNFPDKGDGEVRLYQNFDVSPSWTGINIEFDFKFFTGIDTTTDFFKSLVRLEIDGASAPPDFTRILKEHDPTTGFTHVTAQILFAGLAIDPDLPNARIAFLLSENTGDWSSAVLDNVSISPIPVPAAVWLFGTALIGLVGFGKRKARIAA